MMAALLSLNYIKALYIFFQGFKCVYDYVSFSTLSYLIANYKSFAKTNYLAETKIGPIYDPMGQFGHRHRGNFHFSPALTK